MQTIGSVCIHALLLSLVVSVRSSGCPKEYLRFSQEHTFCQPKNSSCTFIRTGITDAEKELILKLHNEVRSKMAHGRNLEPEAQDMMEMVWDDELAAIAQRHVETCNVGPDCDACRQTKDFQVGQIVGSLYRTGPAPTDVNWNWFFTNLQKKPKNYDDIPRRSDFSQALWAESWAVGCGFAMFQHLKGTMNLYVCNYGPIELIKMKPPFSPGFVCGACPTNTCCNDKCKEQGVKVNYPGLCRRVKDTEAPGLGIRQTWDYVFCNNFNGEEDCQYTSEGEASWNVVSTSRSSMLTTTIEGGQTAIVKFPKLFVTTHDACAHLFVRQMPELAGEEFATKAFFIAGFENDRDPLVFEMNPPPPGTYHEFQEYKYTLTSSNKNLMKVGYKFTVPAGKPRQVVEIRRLIVKRGGCGI